MPRYFFHFTDWEPVADSEGIEFPDLAAVRCAAVDMLADRLKGSGEQLWQSKRWHLSVADASGSTVLMVAVTDEATIGAVRLLEMTDIR